MDVTHGTHRVGTQRRRPLAVRGRHVIRSPVRPRVRAPARGTPLTASGVLPRVRVSRPVPPSPVAAPTGRRRLTSAQYLLDRREVEPQRFRSSGQGRNLRRPHSCARSLIRRRNQIIHSTSGVATRAPSNAGTQPTSPAPYRNITANSTYIARTTPALRIGFDMKSPYPRHRCVRRGGTPRTPRAPRHEDHSSAIRPRSLRRVAVSTSCFVPVHRRAGLALPRMPLLLRYPGSSGPVRIAGRRAVPAASECRRPARLLNGCRHPHPV